ncbi:hypothetical protein HYU13_04160 [Candidatus Woesearchaeota archaeon]|nr:hypothetical protein [Candidatus Woesearchaeota archaeon]
MTTDGELVPSTGTIEEASDKTKLLRQGTTVTKSGDMTFNQALDQGLSATQRTPKAPAAKTGIIARGLTGIKKFNSALGGGPDSTLYRDDNYLWSQASKPTEGAGYLTSGAPSFNPYISKHYAQKTLCLPAIIFNKKKEKQVKCLYRNCIQNHLMRGEPTTICDFANKERNCLYVESAYYLKYHYRGWADNMIKGIIQFAVMLIPGLIHKKLCFTYYATAGQDFCSNPPPFGWRPVLCGIASGYFFFQEISAVFGSKFGFGGSDSQKLTGPDFCSGEEDGLG